MDKIPNSLDLKELKMNDQPVLVWIRVKDAINLIWEDNAKLHDIGAVSQSIQKYGLQELPVYDDTLKAIKAGNGRIETLYQMEKSGFEVPRGIATTESGEWAIPVLTGVDAENIELARAYAIDSNSLTLTGGDVDGRDLLKMYDQEKLFEILTGLLDKSDVDNDYTPVAFQNEAEMLLKIMGNRFEVDLDDFGQPVNSKVLYRVIIDDFDSIDEAQAFASKLGQKARAESYRAANG